MFPVPLLAFLAIGCVREPAKEPAPPPAPSSALHVPPEVGWPLDGFELTVLPAPAAPLDGVRVYLDPGHGVGSNSGNHSSLCIDEQDHNLRVVDHLARSMEAAGLGTPRRARRDNRGPAYSARIDDARGWGADLLLSLHSDARGRGEPWSPSPDCAAHWNDANPGFSVLWSDEGGDDLVAARLTLAQAVAARLVEAGFTAYDGYEYQGIYEGDSEQPGVFVDRHLARRRIRMLRRPPMPSVIIETHNALDRGEEARWQEEATLEAFDAAVIAALSDWSALDRP